MVFMFEWKQTYSVGIASIDAQHQSLFGIAAELYTAMSTGQSKSVMARILARLTSYAQMHFAHEERLLKQFAYPATEEHCREHAQLQQQVVKFQQDYNG